MNAPEEDFTTRCRQLRAEIARQRSELSQAYVRLERPIRYTEYSLRGAGFLRANPWIFAAVPAAVSIFKILWGSRPKKKNIRSLSSPPPTQATGSPPASFTNTLAAWINRGWHLFQLYRRIRSYLP
ncbi:MAG TPA: hypothetical protein VL981_01895 [Candidatus Methylacidiphilales bacterium]|nr:hypothetical protein [Candidatus Methylacidiphilales bacterium]